jgi:hypothetical protein
MNMEARKSGWNNRIHDIVGGALTIGQIRLIASICQDAFNEGHKAGVKKFSDDLLQMGKE